MHARPTSLETDLNGSTGMCTGSTRFFFIKNLAKGLVLKVPYFRTSFYQILVLKVPE